MDTIVEKNYYVMVPKYLDELVEQLQRLNETLDKIIVEQSKNEDKDGNAEAAD